MQRKWVLSLIVVLAFAVVAEAACGGLGIAGRRALRFARRHAVVQTQVQTQTITTTTCSVAPDAMNAPQSMPPVAGMTASTVSTTTTTIGELEEVNALRAQRGLRPYIYDPGLEQAARAAATFRAQRHLFGHVGRAGVIGDMGDFAFLPAGVTANATGCAAYPIEYGWMSCGVNDNYTYAGAASVMGSDNKRYCHLFLR